jgi:hypothetical protein
MNDPCRTPEEVRALTPEQRAAIIDGCVDRLELARMTCEVALEDVAQIRAAGDLSGDDLFLASVIEHTAHLTLAKLDMTFAMAERVA